MTKKERAILARSVQYEEDLFNECIGSSSERDALIRYSLAKQFFYELTGERWHNVCDQYQ